MEKKIKVELTESEISALRHISLVYWAEKGIARQTVIEAEQLYHKFKAIDDASGAKAPSV